MNGCYAGEVVVPGSPLQQVGDAAGVGVHLVLKALRVEVQLVNRHPRDVVGLELVRGRSLRDLCGRGSSVFLMATAKLSPGAGASMSRIAPEAQSRQSQSVPNSSISLVELLLSRLFAGRPMSDE